MDRSLLGREQIKTKQVIFNLKMLLLLPVEEPKCVQTQPHYVIILPRVLSSAYTLGLISVVSKITTESTASKAVTTI